MKIFRRQDSHKKKRINPRWRSARGLQSKIRLAKRGYMKKPKIGYGSSKKGRAIELSSLKELNDIKKGEAIILKKVGLKKKIEIIKETITLGIDVLNIKSDFLKQTELKLKLRKEKKNRKVSEKSAKKEKAKKIVEKKEDTEKKEEIVKKTEEELKKEKEKEKEVKDKILTKKEG